MGFKEQGMRKRNHNEIEIVIATKVICMQCHRVSVIITKLKQEEQFMYCSFCGSPAVITSVDTDYFKKKKYKHKPSFEYKNKMEANIWRN
jgi:translation initiation factor 2 beta subunit (eIF-2beta)/eIF-5